MSGCCSDPGPPLYRCLGLIYRTAALPVIEEDRLRAVFLEAMRVSGSDIADRRSEVIEGGGGSFHFVVWGERALDCHAYPAFRVAEGTNAPSSSCAPAPRGLDRELLAIMQEERAIVFVEEAPLPSEDPTAEQRVAAATAGLISPEVAAIFDPRTRRLARVTPETATRLRSGELDSVFASAVVVGHFRAGG